jgi:hypothetical protein
MNFDANASEKLDDLFFLKEDQKIIDQLRSIKKLKETKESLAEVSGIKNERILEKLIELNIRPETLTSLSLIPLVEIAWADGNVDEKEKKEVLACAEKMGFPKGSSDHEILTQWMTHRPSKELLNAWIHYMQGLCEKLSHIDRAELKNELIDNVRAIASSSGGFMGIGSISKSESDMLTKLESAFN